jgi:hypothetical protein
MMMDTFGDLIQIGDAPVCLTSTSLKSTADVANHQQGLRRVSELLLVLGMFLTVGTGGFARPAVAQESPSSSRVWVHTKHSAQRSAGAARVAIDAFEDVSAPSRISEIRNQLSLNVKQLADAMQVGRPAVYSWLQGTTPRESQQVRLKALYDVAQEWKALSDLPVGKYLIAPQKDGVSLLGLLRASELDRERIYQGLKRIGSTIQHAANRKQATRYRSAASFMGERGIKPASRELQQQRIDDEADFG